MPNITSSATTCKQRIAALVCFAALSLLTNLALAATPSSVTLGPIKGSTVNWAGSGIGGVTTDETTCVNGTDCDIFTINLTGSPTQYKGLVLNISIGWTLSTNDYDIYVHKGDLTGPVIASSTGGIPDLNESVSIDPTVSGTGTYTVHIVDATVAPEDRYHGTATITTPPTDNQAHGTAPGYANYVPPPGLGDRSGEPSIGSNWNSGRIMAQAIFDTLQVTFDTSTSPATANWALKDAKIADIVTSDPIMFTDPQTGRTFVSQLAGPTSLSAFTDNDGETYTNSQGAGIASGIDHQTIGGGPFRLCTADQLLATPVPCAQLAARGPLTQYSHAVYYASQDVGDAEMALSQDGGLTYEAAHPMYTLVDCSGLHGHIKVSNSGIVYVPNKNCGHVQGVIVSQDNGLTFSVQHVTGSTPSDSDPSIGIGAKGRLYFGYVNGDGHPHVAVSDDQGRSWHNDQDVGLPFALKNAAFPETVAGDNDRASFFFLGTQQSGPATADDSNGVFNGVWHAYVATTYDGGKSWFTVDVTPNDPVQLGAVCLFGTTCQGTTRNLLDFNDITVDATGRVFAVYTDGCISAACIAKGNDPSASHTGADNDGATKATIIRQQTGKGLFKSQDSGGGLKP